jgi:uncharacterized protein YukE
MTNINQNEEYFEKLLVEYKEQREELKSMILELRKYKDKIGKIFPDNLDHRYVRYFEEKVKAVTELYKAILDIRKEISKNIKDEMEFRRKISPKNNEDEDMNDIRKMVHIVEQYNKIKPKENIENVRRINE